MSTYLPRAYTTFVAHHPEVAEAFSKLGEACNAGPLDEKTRHLIKLGIATALQAEGAVKGHARQALDAGATVEEVRHAVILAIPTMGFPRMIAAMGWVNEVVDARTAP